MAMKQVGRLAVAALVLGSDAARVEMEDMEIKMHQHKGPQDTEPVVTNVVREEEDEPVVTEVADEGKKSKKKGFLDHLSDVGGYIKDGAKAVFTKTECCCSNKEPLLLYVCIKKTDEEAQSESAGVFSVMFKSGESEADIASKETPEKRSLIPVEKNHYRKDRTEANEGTLDVNTITQTAFHSRAAHMCKDGEKVNTDEGIEINSYEQLTAVPESGEQTQSFYRYQLKADGVKFYEDSTMSIAHAIYKKKEDKPSFQCIDEESDVTVSFNAKKGAECKEVKNCKKILHVPQCGPEEDAWSLYELYGRSDGVCEHLVRGQWCPKRGYENTWMKPIYGDTFGMYKVCKCDGEKKCK